MITRPVRFESLFRSLFLATVLVAPAHAQQAEAGQTADSSVGQVGQRQTRETVAESIAPMARIDTRIRNRVQLRVDNRIGRNYDPQYGAASRIDVAKEQARTAGRPKAR